MSALERAASLNTYEVQALRAFGGVDPPIPWGAWVSAVMEDLHGKGLIEGESDATLTAFGREVLDAIVSPQEVAE